MEVSTESRDRRIVGGGQLAEKMARKKSERFTYLVAAVMSSLGITSMAVMAVYYRFYWQMEVKFKPRLLILKLCLERLKFQFGDF